MVTVVCNGVVAGVVVVVVVVVVLEVVVVGIMVVVDVVDVVVGSVVVVVDVVEGIVEVEMTCVVLAAEVISSVETTFSSMFEFSSIVEPVTILVGMKVHIPFETTIVLSGQMHHPFRHNEPPEHCCNAAHEPPGGETKCPPPETIFIQDIDKKNAEKVNFMRDMCIEMNVYQVGTFALVHSFHLGKCKGCWRMQHLDKQLNTDHRIHNLFGRDKRLNNVCVL